MDLNGQKWLGLKTIYSVGIEPQQEGFMCIEGKSEKQRDRGGEKEGQRMSERKKDKKYRKKVLFLLNSV